MCNDEWYGADMCTANLHTYHYTLIGRMGVLRYPYIKVPDAFVAALVIACSDMQTKPITALVKEMVGNLLQHKTCCEFITLPVIACFDTSIHV